VNKQVVLKENAWETLKRNLQHQDIEKNLESNREVVLGWLIK